MKINKVISKKMLKVVTALTLTGCISIGSAIAVSPTFSNYILNQDDYLKDHFMFEQRQIEYLESIKNADLRNYDSDFVNLYRNGKITIKGNTYDINELFIEVGYENNQKRIFLVSYHNPEFDVLTGCKKNNFIRESILIFNKSLCFFQIYEENKDELFDNNLNINENRLINAINIIYSFDQTIHDKTPETAYKHESISKTR